MCGRSSEVIPCQFSHERPKRGDADVTGNKNKGITTTASLINSQEKDRKRKRGIGKTRNAIDVLIR